jgi:hypothetical protein
MILVACLLALSFGASTAEAIELGFDQASGYVGYATPGNPASPDFEVEYITYLIGMATNSSVADVVIDPPGPGGTVETDFYRSEWSYSLMTPVMFADKLNGPANATYPAGANSYNYVLAKYGNATGAQGQVSYVWFSATGFSGDIVLPSAGLSHISVFNSFKKDVPDGGATLMLLGCALVGLGALRRKFRA